MATIAPGSPAHSSTAPTPLRAADWVALVLLIVGGLNWGLVGAFGFDLVAALFGAGSGVSRAVYVIVGLSAIYTLWLATRLRHK